MIQDIAHLLHYIEDLHSELNRQSNGQVSLCQQRDNLIKDLQKAQITEPVRDQAKYIKLEQVIAT
jgi:hypothetical protein